MYVYIYKSDRHFNLVTINEFMDKLMNLHSLPTGYSEFNAQIPTKTAPHEETGRHAPTA